MKKTFRRRIALLLVVSLLMGVSACGVAKSDDQSAAAATPEMGKVEPQIEAPNKPSIPGDVITDPSSNPPADIGGYEETPTHGKGLRRFGSLPTIKALPNAPFRR